MLRRVPASKEAARIQHGISEVLVHRAVEFVRSRLDHEIRSALSAELHRRAGKPLPDGWAIDLQGQPTTDPDAALAGAMLPFGGHKGSAIGTMIELLAGIMIGDLTSPEVLDFLGTTALAPFHGELILAMCPDKFASSRTGDPFARAEVLFEAIQGQGARLPSQRRFAARARAESQGIDLTGAEVAQMDRFLALGLDAVA